MQIPKVCTKSAFYTFSPSMRPPFLIAPVTRSSLASVVASCPPSQDQLTIKRLRPAALFTLAALVALRSRTTGKVRGRAQGVPDLPLQLNATESFVWRFCRMRQGLSVDYG